MVITQNAAAGTLESSDALVSVAPGNGGLELSIESVVLRQFGDTIAATAREVLAEMSVSDARVTIQDRGALDLVLRARIEAAVRRAAGGGAG